MAEPILREPRRDDTAADAKSLEQMGRLEPQPSPAATSSPAPEQPPEAQEPAAAQDTAELQQALAGAGVTATAEDHAAMQALSKLDGATLEAVTRWIQTKPGKTSK